MTMNKTLIALIILLLVSVSPGFAGAVETIEAVYNDTVGEVTVQGTASTLEKGVLVIEIIDPSGSLLYFGTTSVDESNAFALSIEVGSLGSGTYQVRAADYVGGAYTSTSFTVGAEIEDEETGLVKESEDPNASQLKITEGESELTVIATVGSDGEAVLKIDLMLVDQMIDSGSTVIVIKAKSNQEDSESFSIEFDADSLQLMISSSLDTLIIETSIGSLELNMDLFRSYASAEGNLEFVMKTIANDLLSESQRLKVGNRPVIDFSIVLGDQVISDFSFPIHVTIPYELAPAEELDQLVVYYLNDAGELEVIPNGYFNPATGLFKFKTNHFSRFALGYNPIQFGDVPDTAWYTRAVKFSAAREIANGVDVNKFDPYGKLTRGQFITMLMRAYDVNPIEAVDNFVDAGNTYYTGYLAASKAMGIANGVGGNRFEPESLITRQEMFTLIHKTMVLLDDLDVANDEGLATYKDVDAIAPWALESVKSLVSAGLVEGSHGMLHPQGESLRAEMAQLIYRLLKR